jgi:hypothetical protein
MEHKGRSWVRIRRCVGWFLAFVRSRTKTPLFCMDLMNKGLFSKNHIRARFALKTLTLDRRQCDQKATKSSKNQMLYILTWNILL